MDIDPTVEILGVVSIDISKYYLKKNGIEQDMEQHTLYQASTLATIKQSPTPNFSLRYTLTFVTSLLTLGSTTTDNWWVYRLYY